MGKLYVMNSYRFNLVKPKIILEIFLFLIIFQLRFLKAKRCWLYNEIFCIMINTFCTHASTAKFAGNSLHILKKEIYGKWRALCIPVVNSLTLMYIIYYGLILGP